MQTVCASDHVPRSLISLIIIDQQKEATDLITGFLLGLQHILATPIKGAYLSIPNQNSSLIHAPTCPNKETTYQLENLCWIKHPAQKSRWEKPLTQIGSLILYTSQDFLEILSLLYMGTMFCQKCKKAIYYLLLKTKSCLITHWTKCFLTKSKRNEK